MDYKKIITEAQEAAIALINKLDEVVQTGSKTKDELSKFSYDVPIENLKLSTYTNNILKSHNVYKISQLVQFTLKDLIEMGFTNKRTLYGIVVSLYMNGYHYKGSK